MDSNVWDDPYVQAVSAWSLQWKDRESEKEKTLHFKAVFYLRKEDWIHLPSYYYLILEKKHQNMPFGYINTSQEHSQWFSGEETNNNNNNENLI